MLLEGKIVVVTGGTGQLGRVVVRRFEREGAKIFLTTRGRIPAGTFPPPVLRNIIPIRADVTREKSVTNLFRTIAGKANKADILINTVGGFSATGPIARTDPKAWEKMLELNLKSVFLCCRAFLRQKGIGDFGRIFNIAAQTVYRASRNRAAYAVSKGAVATLTELLGEELRGTGITANAFAPSILDTPSNREAMPGEDFSAWVDPGVIAEEMIQLCRPGASAINGAVIPIFGGV
ncbi:MAG TPA: SDR family oxidoreductase [Bacteroidota bacterium]|nr:SDR family oxidoreductase [Bacteroidota bacterium]